MLSPAPPSLSLMAVSRLFLAEAELHLRHRGFARSRRWFSSSSPSPSSSSASYKVSKVSKKAGAANKEKAEAINSFVDRYMQTRPGSYPKVKEVQDEVGCPWGILKEILKKLKSKVLPDSNTDKQIPTESHVAIDIKKNTDRDKLSRPESGYEKSICEAIDMEKNADRGKLARYESAYGNLTEMLGAESRMMVDKDPVVLSTMKVTDNAALDGPQDVQDPIESLATSGTVPGSQLLCSDNKKVEQGHITSVSTSETHLLDAKLTEGAQCRSEENLTDAYCLAPTAGSSVVDIGASGRKVISLVDFFKRNAEKVELNRKNISTFKQGTSLDPKQDSKEDIINAERSQQDKPLNSSEARGVKYERRSEVQGLIDRILELSKDRCKHPSLANERYDKMNRINGELRAGVTRGSMREALNFLNLKEEHASAGQFEKTEGKMSDSDIEKEPKEEDALGLVTGNSRGQEKEFVGSESGEEKLQLDKEEMVVKLPLVPSHNLRSEDSDSDVAAFDYLKLELGDEVLTNKGVKLNASPYEETGSGENCILLKFLPKAVKVNDVAISFGDCGPIAEIRIVPSRRENKFSYAFIYFKTEDGLRKALSKTDTVVGGADVVLESASPTKIQNSLFTVEPSSNEDFPEAFLKNPGRTVMIKGLPDNLSFQHLKRALSSWGQVSGFAMGSVSCNIYVEFESEDSKERALTEAAVSVLGRKLSIHRVDAPNTTVVRISNVNPQSGPAKVRSVCDSYGRVKRVVSRDIDTFDVHYKLFEWPNMVKILNRINGVVVDQHQWIAQPATIIPAEVLQAVWIKPEGQKVVYDLIRNLCRRIEEKRIDITPMVALAQECYGDS